MPGTALAFTPVEPATCPNTTEVNWTYNLSDFGTGAWMVPKDPNSSGHYSNNINNVITFYGNSRITQFGFRVDYFDTEFGFDRLDVGDLILSDTVYNKHLTGSISSLSVSPGWFDVPIADTININDQFVRIKFFSDFSVTRNGISLGRARVCDANPASPLLNREHRLDATIRNSGVLLGTGDVVYYVADVGSAKVGEQCSLAHDTFALWGDPASDFDLYVRCGAQPTETQYLYRGFSTDAQEFVHTTPANCPCGSQWHIAVTSFSGSGFFNLVEQKHYASEHRGNASVGTTTHVDPATLLAYSQEVSRGFKHFFGANEGARYWDSITLTNQSTAGDVVIFSGQNGRPESDRCLSGTLTCFFSDCFVKLFANWFDGPTLSHELGHHTNCLMDEYEDGVGTECGHSIMGSQFDPTQSNYCYCLNQGTSNKCLQGQGDHGWDPTPQNLTSLRTGTAWINLQSRAPWPGVALTPMQIG